jgi:hypothetical protein
VKNLWVIFTKMEKVLQLLQRLRAATPEEQEKAILAIILKHAHRAIDLNIEQLMNGIDAEGRSLGEYKSAAYAEFKRSLNPRGVVDLRLTGDWQDEMYLEADKFPVYMNSSNWKTLKLTTDFGENILGLTQENKQKFLEAIKEDIIAYYRSLFQL